MFSRASGVLLKDPRAERHASEGWRIDRWLGCLQKSTSEQLITIILPLILNKLSMMQETYLPLMLLPQNFQWQFPLYPVDGSKAI